MAAASSVSPAILTYERTGRDLPDAEMLACRKPWRDWAQSTPEDAMGGAGVGLRFDADSRRFGLEAEGGVAGDEDAS
ncbi:hypothetical protein OHD62_06940 [Mesorhizobium sp. YC-39]|uniref:hypothetical protein n=1 Tax=unclassified Mesorhizobium TaxID=325217 RepID=UPI0021E6FBEC|nr:MULTISPECIES: hypothetical protein [unclassified Mesorhizobium]MCV3205501.1 hypothetical protein [Mesorhizobium sp. YC-2]MCV3228100.1 hypothetical protein [Mesorhizobium sp. YC-39]